MAEIVVGVDGSAASQAALQWAIDDLDRRGGGGLHVVYAWEYPIAAMAPSPIGSVVPPANEMHDAATQALDTILKDAELEGRLSEGSTLHHYVNEGSPASNLLSLADEVDADVIVVGARGRGGFLGLLVGSVATQVVNHSKRPTVVVPSPASSATK